MTVPSSFFQHIPLEIAPSPFSSHELGSVIDWNPPMIPNHYTNPDLIPPRNPQYRMTYVWDLDRTLVNADTVPGYKEDDDNAPPVIRPYSREVLRLLQSPDVEFIIWTAGIYAHAYRVMRDFPDIRFDYIISRSEFSYPRKDIRRLRRPMNSIILIDDRGEVSDVNPGHVLITTPFEPLEPGGIQDTAMIFIGNILARASIMFRCYHDAGFSNISLSSLIDSPLVRRVWIRSQEYREVDIFTSQDELDRKIIDYNRRYLIV